MFKGLHTLINKVKKSKPKGPASDVPIIPILSAENLLATEKRQHILNEIRALLSLPEEEYNHHFLSVIHSFAEFVQNLPETERSYYASIGGLLDHALERTSLSLFLCRTYLLPEGSTLASLSRSEMLWVYAVFTASLLLNIGKIVTQLSISITDETSRIIKNWLPYAGTMLGQGSHYVYNFNQGDFDHMLHLVTPLLARQILPAGAPPPDDNSEGEDNNTEQIDHTSYGGFCWLASNPDVLEAWLALLSDESRGVGTLLTVIPLADAQILEGYLSERKVFHHNLSPKTIALLSQLNKNRKATQEKLNKDIKDKMLAEHANKELYKTAEKLGEGSSVVEQPKTAKQALFGFPAVSQTHQAATQAATANARIDQATQNEITKQFVQWLQNANEKKSISVNQANASAYHVKEGVILTHQAIQQFLNDTKNTTMNAMQLQQVLTQAELVKPVQFAQALQMAQQTGNLQSALLIQNPYIAFPSGPPPITTNVITMTGQQPQQIQQQYQQEAQSQHEQYVQQQQQQQIKPNPPGGRFPR